MAFSLSLFESNILLYFSS